MLSGSESSTALSDTLTLSPFSDSSLRSELTSDELPDLGAFTAVFHTLSNFQPIPRSNRLHIVSPTSASQSSSESVQLDSSQTIPSSFSANSYLLVNQDDLSPSSELPLPIVSSSLPSPFLLTARPNQSAFSLDDSNDHHAHDDSPSDTSSQSPYSTPLPDTKEEDNDLILLDSDEGVFELDSDMASHSSPDFPKLGLDEALSFLAAERDRWVADRSRPDKQIKDPAKRKRRRKRPATKTGSARTPRGAITDIEAVDDDEGIAGGRSSSASSQPQDPSDDTTAKSGPSAPHLSRRQKRRLKQLAAGIPLPVSPTFTVSSTPPNTALVQPPGKGKGRMALHHFRSTPQLRTKQPKAPGPVPQEDENVEKHPNPCVEKLRSLTRKLIKLFPNDQQRLEDLLSGACGRESGIALPPPTDAPASSTQEETMPIVNDLDVEEGGETSAESPVIDVRGPSPRPPSPAKRVNNPSGKGKNKPKDKPGKVKDKASSPERLVHVFIDHSNILFGLLSWLKRSGKKRANLPLPPLPTHRRSQSSSAHHSVHPLMYLHHFHSTPNRLSATLTNNDGSPSSMSPPSSTPEPSGSLGSTLFLPSSGSPSSGGLMPPPNPAPRSRPLKPTNHLSHAALALILERGRPVTRRVMVTSSPLYQPMESAENLGYEVRIFMRVPDLGDGMDRERTVGKTTNHGRSVSLGSAASSQQQQQQQTQRTTLGSPVAVRGDFPPTLKDPKWVSSGSSSTSSATTSSPQNTRKKRAQRKRGDQQGSVSTESEVIPPPPSTPPQQTSITSLGLASPASSGGVPVTPQRIKYREQGVDELLQLKLHQAIASADELPYPLPPGSTIVLATGDGNVGQFNEDGFLGSVRTALRRGWEVELYAWEVGLSKRWAKEFGLGKKGGEYEGRFRVIGLEQFGEDLIERSWW